MELVDEKVLNVRVLCNGTCTIVDEFESALFKIVPVHLVDEPVVNILFEMFG